MTRIIEASITLVAGHPERVNLVTTLLKNHQGHDYYAYERGDCWYVGLGASKSLVIDSRGQSATIIVDHEERAHPVKTSLSDVARDFLDQHWNQVGRVFGQVGFNYAAHTRGYSYSPGSWPLLALMIPRNEVILRGDQVQVIGYDSNEVLDLTASIKEASHVRVPRHIPAIGTADLSGEYTSRVQRAQAEITNGQYLKVIPSRAVDIPERVDMPGTLLQGRQSNSPSRTFCLNHAGYQATGFSPELVMSLDKGVVKTEPLAGTRSCKGTKAEVAKLRQELETDSKEIVEHVISVKEAIREIGQLCDRATVDDFMSVRERGSVQHLGSCVAGHLAPEKDMWDALNVLFPSITASGIPKQAAIEAIERLESRPRELYSGAVLMLEGSDSMEAALVLRTVFQGPDQQWIQAGAGVIAESKAARELEETCEKLASIAPYIVSESAVEEKDRREGV
ncbi:salicylate synthetase [Aspergillus heteromorphus CBS 117.55]|uniref:Salicylate synthetase n=1 Tax=Aspergillus heteromorphus CBS 117.55 TaxID=1448321 RepID=A0A317WHL9_9EURO|nr:salicylate synthetase [Aspergillus heteromorphus CBS 117.55]PWY84762.1 salicylate synthetase [Aspergillus heteromorphus CBS 117.55]